LNTIVVDHLDGKFYILWIPNYLKATCSMYNDPKYTEPRHTKKTSRLIHSTHSLGQIPTLCPNPYPIAVHIYTTLHQRSPVSVAIQEGVGCSWAMALEKTAFSASSGDNRLGLISAV
jgi:hypothetical protein